MTTFEQKQPEALCLAAALDGSFPEAVASGAAYELRRLYAVNQEMLKALKLAFPSINPKAIDRRRAEDNPIDECYINTIVRKAIEKAEGTV